MHFFHINYQFIKILLGSQMYVVTGVEFIVSINLLISSVNIRNGKIDIKTYRHRSCDILEISCGENITTLENKLQYFAMHMTIILCNFCITIV